jgi:hypothetical protein
MRGATPGGVALPGRDSAAHGRLVGTDAPGHVGHGRGSLLDCGRTGGGGEHRGRWPGGRQRRWGAVSAAGSVHDLAAARSGRERDHDGRGGVGIRSGVAGCLRRFASCRCRQGKRYQGGQQLIGVELVPTPEPVLTPEPVMTARADLVAILEEAPDVLGEDRRRDGRPALPRVRDPGEVPSLGRANRRHAQASTVQSSSSVNSCR